MGKAYFKSVFKTLPAASDQQRHCYPLVYNSKKQRFQVIKLLTQAFGSLGGVVGAQFVFCFSQRVTFGYPCPVLPPKRVTTSLLGCTNLKFDNGTPSISQVTFRRDLINCRALTWYRTAKLIQTIMLELFSIPVFAWVDDFFWIAPDGLGGNNNNAAEFIMENLKLVVTDLLGWQQGQQTCCFESR